jgi:hypothetical protein
VASLYAFGAQGRPKGIRGLRYGQAFRALKYGQVIVKEVDDCPMATDFKTQKRLLYQPVPIPSITRPLLKVYLTFLRPKIAQLINIDADNPRLPMLLGFSTKRNSKSGNGKNHNFLCLRIIILLMISVFYTQALNVMRALKRFADLYTPYHLSTNTVRALVATTTARKRLEGRVSKMEQQSIENISGHTLATSKAFYIKHSRKMDAKRAKAAFEREFGADPSRIKVTNFVFIGLIY